MCIFCKIIQGEIPSEIVYRDDKMIIIKDIEPKAKLHYLAIPTRHYARIEQATAEDLETLGYLFKKVSELSKELGTEGGYRLVVNQGEAAGQTVHHLHVHVLGGQTLDFPDLREHA